MNRHFMHPLFPALAAATILAACAVPDQEIHYDFGLAQPASNEPQLLAAGVISDGMDQRDCALSFDEQHLLYTLQSGRQARIMHLQRQSNVDARATGWSEPTTASFSGEWRDLEPAFVPETRKLYFVSNRPVPSKSEAGEFNIWRTQWQGDRWQEPQYVADVDGPGNEFYPSLNLRGDLYFTARREGGFGGEDIWFAQADGDGFRPPIPLPEAVNTDGDEFNAAIDPSNRYLIFGAARADGPGGGDLYLSTQHARDSWSPSKLLEQGINTPHLDFCPMFRGVDGEVWFTSRRPIERSAVHTRADLRQQWQSPGNGLGDLYRVKIDLNSGN